MGIFDSSTLASALTRGAGAYDEYQADKQKKAALEQDTLDSQLRRQVAQGQLADQQTARALRLKQALAVRAILAGRTDLSPELKRYYEENPDQAERFIGSNVAPPPPKEPVQSTFEGYVQKYLKPGGDVRAAVEQAVAADPKHEYEIRAAGVRMQEAAADNARLAAGQRSNDDITANQRRQKLREEVSGAAARHFLNFPKTPEAVNAVTKTLAAKYAGQLNPDEISGLVVEAMQRGQDQELQMNRGSFTLGGLTGGAPQDATARPAGGAPPATSPDSMTAEQAWEEAKRRGLVR